MESITDVAVMAAILAYCKEHYQPCWIIRTPPESKIGGFSAQLLELGAETARIKIANGDVMSVPISQISIRVKGL